MTSRRRRRVHAEPSPVRAVVGWGGFSVVLGCVVLVVLEPGAWQRILWLAPAGALIVGVAAAAVWAMPMRALAPQEAPEHPPGAPDDLS